MAGQRVGLLQWHAVFIIVFSKMLHMTFVFRLLLSICLFVGSSNPARAAGDPVLPQTDRVRLAEAFRLADWIGDRLWPGWSTTPFAVLLVTQEHEFLVRHPHPGSEWRAIGHDALLGSQVFTRPRVYPVDLQASFPLDELPTVVVGQAEQTSSRHSTAWVTMLLHEHFHQWQSGAPDYFASVGRLGLAGEDKTGMWMLNYPFPYENAQAVEDYARLGKAVMQALAGDGKAVADAAAAQARLAASVGEKDFRYLDFQLWQEGVSRYTELRAAELAASDYQPSAAFAALPDYRPYAEQAASIRKRIMGELENPDLAKRKRIAVYALGAGQALMLDRFNAAWRERYLRHRFTMSKPVREAAGRMR